VGMLGWFLLLAALILGAGWYYLRQMQAQARAAAHRELEAIADLKAQQIENWRRERLSDGSFFSEAGFAARDVAAFLAEPENPVHRAELLHWLGLLQGGRRYVQVALFDAQLQERLATDSWPQPPDETLRRQIEAALRAPGVRMTELRLHGDSGQVFAEILFPINPPGTPRGQRETTAAIGVVVMRLDPTLFLYPLLQSWPTPSPTAETMLLRRDGDEVVYLNEARHQPGSAMRLRLPVSRDDLPAARGARGESGTMEGRDYRGVPVVANVRSIEESPWFMVAKVDSAEIYAPLHRITLAVGSVAGALLLAAALGMGLFWRLRDAETLRRELAAAQEQRRLSRQLNEELQHGAAELERRVAARTAELEVALKRAEVADRLKSSFLATMSHELRTPLNSIIGFTGILLQELAGPLAAEQRKQLEMVQGSARHLLALINDILDLSKIEAGDLTLKREPFDVRAVIIRAAEVVRPLAGLKALALRVEVSPDIGTTVGDARRLEQILLNLLQNAVKFTPQGGVSLTASVEKTADAGPQLVVAVGDTGIGIQADDMASLFKPFQQVDSSSTRQQEGTGLGLAICRRLSRLMGGDVEVRSEWSRGSTFTLRIPWKGEPSP